MKNKLSDLNDHLFQALERCNDENLPLENVETEVKRAQAIVGIADRIIDNAKVTLEAMKLVSNGTLGKEELPENFQVKQIGR